jgi:Sulfotransferase family
MRHLPAPFVVGVPRSGTTLLRLMLDAHSELAIPFETHFVPDLIDAAGKQGTSPERLAEMVITHYRWGDFRLDADELRDRFRVVERPTPGAFVRAFYKLYAERRAKPQWGDKTPKYQMHMRRIEQALPEARFIHLIRDDRDVALSVLRLHFGPDSVEEAAERWKNRIEKARSQNQGVNHYLEFRYEDLVLDTESTLRRVCEFCGLPWDPAVLRYYERAEESLQEKARDLPPRRPGQSFRPAALRISHALTKEPPRDERVGQWRTEMSAAERAVYERIAGKLLAELGYEIGETLHEHY